MSALQLVPFVAAVSVIFFGLKLIQVTSRHCASNSCIREGCQTAMGMAMGPTTRSHRTTRATASLVEKTEKVKEKMGKMGALECIKLTFFLASTILPLTLRLSPAQERQGLRAAPTCCQRSVSGSLHPGVSEGEAHAHQHAATYGERAMGPSVAVAALRAGGSTSDAAAVGTTTWVHRGGEQEGEEEQEGKTSTFRQRGAFV